MTRPWPVVQRDLDSAAADATEVQPGSDGVEGRAADSNLELFSETRTSWMVPLSASVMIERLWWRQRSCQIVVGAIEFCERGLAEEFLGFGDVVLAGTKAGEGEFVVALRDDGGGFCGARCAHVGLERRRLWLR